MFYCESCAKKNKWPNDSYLASSRGPCEVCGKTANCFDVPTKQLSSTDEDEDKIEDDNEALEEINRLIDYTGSEVKMRCYLMSEEGGCFRKYAKQIIFSGMLPKKVGDQMCEPCLAHWHAQMARNALISVMRRR